MKMAVRFSIQRIAVFDRAVRAGKYPNARTIARELEVGHRTVQRDIEFLRDRLGAPLVFDSRRNGYYYDGADFRLPHMAMTEGEMVALLLAERVLQQYRGTPYAADLRNAFQKITEGLSEQITVDLSHLSSSLSFRITASSELDPSLFRELDAAIRDRRRLTIRYYSAASEEEKEREVDPYHLASIDGHWYLVGHCHLRGEVRMFAPSRIRSVEATEATFESPDNFRIEDYLMGSFSVLRGGLDELHRVQLRFTGEAVKYIQDRTWHVSQRILWERDGSILLTMELSHLREIERFALSWGENCEVLAPAELRNRVAAQLGRAIDRYISCDPNALRHHCRD